MLVLLNIFQFGMLIFIYVMLPPLLHMQQTIARRGTHRRKHIRCRS